MKKKLIAIGVVVLVLVLVVAGSITFTVWRQSSQVEEQRLVKQYFLSIQKNQRKEVKEFMEENPALVKRKQKNKTSLDYALELQRYSIAVDLIDYKVKTSTSAMIAAANSLLDYNHLQGNISKEQKERETVFKAMAFNKLGDINAQDSFGNTALHIAASKGDIEITQWLVQNGADTTIKNNDYQTVLAMSTIKGCLECMKAIERQNSSLLKELDKEKKNILHLAVENMHIDLYEYILNVYPESIFMRDKEGQTPLDMAVNYNDDKSIRYLSSYLERSNSN